MTIEVRRSEMVENDSYFKAVAEYKASNEFFQDALEWARKNMRCDGCQQYLPYNQCNRGVEEELGPWENWGCTFWEPGC